MKKIKLIMALATCSVAACMTSCDDDEIISVDNGVEYAFVGTCEFSNKATAEDSAFVSNAFKEAGVPLDGYTLVIAGKDSADVNSQLTETMDKVVEKVSALSERLNFTVGAKGAEKQYVNADNDKEHPTRVWYQKEIGFPEVTGGGSTYNAIESGHEYRFVTGLDADISEFFWQKLFLVSNYTGTIFFDLNRGAGGKYIYLQFEHDNSSYKEGKDGEFKWDDKYKEKYITHVIAVYGGNPSDKMTVNGRTYKRATGDLNKGAGGEYIWLYTTTDPVYTIGGKTAYLNTGGSGYKQGCQVVGHTSDFSPSWDASYYFDGHGRSHATDVVQGYDTHGNEKYYYANLNEGSGGYYIYLVLTYCTKDPS